MKSELRNESEFEKKKDRKKNPSQNMDMEIQPVPWWNRRSRMERRFIGLISSLLFVSVGLSIGLVGVIYKPELFIDNNNSDHHATAADKEALVVHNELDPR